MVTFADRLREEIRYLGLTRKELAVKAGIKQRALDMYLGTQASMPPADVAVKIAKALNVTVEYLVNGEATGKNEAAHNEKYQDIEKDLDCLPNSVFDSLGLMIHAIAEREKKLKE